MQGLGGYLPGVGPEPDFPLKCARFEHPPLAESTFYCRHRRRTRHYFCFLQRAEICLPPASILCGEYYPREVSGFSLTLSPHCWGWTLLSHSFHYGETSAQAASWVLLSFPPDPGKESDFLVGGLGRKISSCPVHPILSLKLSVSREVTLSGLQRQLHHCRRLCPGTASGSGMRS